MNTRCTISIKNDDGSITSTHCYTLGHLEHTGLILHQEYKDCEKIKKLLKMGHIQKIEKEINIPSGYRHSIDYPVSGVTLFLHRDSNEKITQFNNQNFDTVNEFKCLLSFEEYNYFFNYIEKIWYVYNPIAEKFTELGKTLLSNQNLHFTEKEIDEIKQQRKFYKQNTEQGFKFSMDKPDAIIQNNYLKV